LNQESRHGDIARICQVGTTVGITLLLAAPIVVFFAGASLRGNEASIASEQEAKSGSKWPAKNVKEAAQPDGKNAPGDDDGLEADEDLTALIVPSTMLSKARLIDKLKFLQALRGLLMEGMATDGDTLAAAKRHFEAAHLVLADDPRAPYAYRRPVRSMRAETAQERKTRETRQASARQWQQQAQSTLDQAGQQMTDIKAQREQAAAEYRQATAEKRPLLAEARKKSHELAERAKDVEYIALTPEKIKSRLTALETYVPLDPETEKTRLLATLKSAD